MPDRSTRVVYVAVALPLQRDMEQAVCGKSAMIAVTDLVTLHLGPTTILVVVKVDPAPDMTANELRKASTEITEKLRAVDPRISYIFFRY
jgi:divalent metal cation (Fe/Co/Zn/Cd) transporter